MRNTRTGPHEPSGVADIEQRLKTTGRTNRIAVHAVAALAVLGVALGAASAKADNFSFSFTNTIGNVSGTVTGEILGLTNNATGPASEVLITAFPSGLNSALGAAPINAMLWDQQDQNSFTETAGVVTAGEFWAIDTINSNPSGAQLDINGDVGRNLLSLDGVDAAAVYGANGLPAANIQPLVATPEPASLAVVAVGLGALGMIRRRKRS